MSRRNVSAETSEDIGSEATSHLEAAKASPRRRWWRIFAAAAVLLAVVLSLAPSVAVRFFLPGILALASGVVNGEVAAEGGAFGWLQPLELRGVVARDGDGNTLAEIPELKTEISLWSLIQDRSNLHTLRVRQPVLRIIVGPDGTNLEKFLQPLLAQPPSEEPLSVAWDIEDATAEVIAAQDDRVHSRWEFLELSGSLRRAEATSLSVVADADVVVADHVGHLRIDVSTSQANADEQGAGIAATLKQVPLDFLTPLLARLSPGLSITGLLNGKVEGKLEPGTLGTVTWQDLAASRLLFRAPQWLGEDQIACATLESAGEATWDRDRVALSLDAKSDYGTVRGHASAVAAGQSPATTLLVSGGAVDLEADIDLARIAAALPRTMRLRDDVQIDSGRAQFHVSSRPANDATRWTASLLTTDFAARRGNTPLNWRSPLRANLVARNAKERWEVEQLRCESEFLNAALEGTADVAQVRLDANLERLTSRLREFFDLPPLQGLVEGLIHWQRHPPDIVAKSRFVLRDFGGMGTAAVSLPEVTLTADATLRHEPSGAWSELREFAGRLTMQSDELNLRLPTPVDLQSDSFQLPLTLQVRADLSNWQDLLQAILARRPIPSGPRPGMPPSATQAPFVLERFAGQLTAEGQATVNATALVVDALHGEIQSLQCFGPGLRMDEPRFTWNISGELDQASRTWHTRQAAFTSSALAASADGVKVAWSEGLGVDGSFDYRANLARLSGWLPTVSAATPVWSVAGEVVGQAKFTSGAPRQLEFHVEGELRDVRVTQSAARTIRPVSTAPAGAERLLWHEPRVAYALDGRSQGSGALTCEQLRVAGKGLALTATGQLQALASAPALDLEGHLDYDWDALRDRLQLLLGPQLVISGKRRDGFWLRGPLKGDPSNVIPPGLAGGATFGWQSISWNGVVAGPATAKAVLQNALLQVEPLDVPVSEGRLTAAPQVDFRGATARLVVPPGTILRDLRISPQMCGGWLQFVAPLLASATRAEGTFSLQLDELAMPLAQPTQLTAAGAIAVSQATVGPGPLAQSVLGLADRVAAIAERRAPRLSNLVGPTLLDLPPQTIAFDVRNGRVLHRELQVRVKELTLLTRGSVGFDQSLDVTAELPIPESWVQKNRLLAAFAGEPLKIPIRGSLVQPQLDEGVLKDLTTRLLGNEGNKLLEEGVRRGLDRLFRPN